MADALQEHDVEGHAEEDAHGRDSEAKDQDHTPQHSTEHAQSRSPRSARSARPSLQLSLSKDPEELPEEILQRFEPLGQDLLGEGAFAVVRLLRNRLTGELLAMKCVEKYPLQIRNMISQMVREVRIQQALSHPNILRLVEVTQSETHLFMLLEYCEKGSLRLRVSQSPSSRLSETEAGHYFKQIVSGVSWMHRNNCVHRDLKLDNILLNSRDEVKICDFGWSADVEIEKTLKTVCGTTAYWPPEIWENTRQDEGVDLWALGCLLYEMMASHAPFFATDEKKLRDRVLDLDYTFPPWMALEARAIISSLLRRNSCDRLSCSALLSHHWIIKFDIATRGEKGSEDAASSQAAGVTIKSRSSRHSLAHQCTDDPFGLRGSMKTPLESCPGRGHERSVLQHQEHISGANDGQVFLQRTSAGPCAEQQRQQQVRHSSSPRHTQWQQAARRPVVSKSQVALHHPSLVQDAVLPCQGQRHRHSASSLPRTGEEFRKSLGRATSPLGPGTLMFPAGHVPDAGARVWQGQQQPRPSTFAHRSAFAGHQVPEPWQHWAVLSPRPLAEHLVTPLSPPASPFLSSRDALRTAPVTSVAAAASEAAIASSAFALTSCSVPPLLAQQQLAAASVSQIASPRTPQVFRTVNPHSSSAVMLPALDGSPRMNGDSSLLVQSPRVTMPAGGIFPQHGGMMHPGSSWPAPFKLPAFAPLPPTPVASPLAFSPLALPLNFFPTG